MSDLEHSKPVFIDDLWLQFSTALAYPQSSNGWSILDIEAVFREITPQTILHFGIGADEGAITAPVLKSLQDYQSAVLRAYSVVIYGTPRLKVLPPSVRRQILIKYFVKSGTTTVDADQKDVILSIAKEAIEKMDSWQLFILISFFILAFMTKEGYRMWIDRQKARDGRIAELDQRRIEAEAAAEKQRMGLDERRIEADKARFADEQETARIRLLTQAFTRVPQTQLIDRHVSEGMNALTRVAVATGEAEVLGVPLTDTEAADLLRAPRKEREGMSQNGMYMIKKINFDYEPGQIYSLRYCESGEEFLAEAVPVEVSESQLQALSLFAHKKMPVKLKVNLSRYGGVVTRAFILGVDADDCR